MTKVTKVSLRKSSTSTTTATGSRKVVETFQPVDTSVSTPSELKELVGVKTLQFFRELEEGYEEPEVRALSITDLKALAKSLKLKTPKGVSEDDLVEQVLDQLATGWLVATQWREGTTEVSSKVVVAADAATKFFMDGSPLRLRGEQVTAKSSGKVYIKYILAPMSNKKAVFSC